ncbi:hypothetical protein BWQ96_03921 [Gracilariopsis chorda]|uniref:Uncharacterized protein n=1 Tax=Gracilariopsis chorda TaxID=448386 RepID=A0A2V3IW08_9FLOR|nr:hypothetical protein BWQ96_03921 [Gracilariopsis chorda]|eukprot:PXF46265.1 hypothetical protein BWQ96_03921 [Gracilariopsis chorda]
MTLCPYKWFLYIASVWAVLYVMLETWMHMRAATKAVDPQSSYVEDEEDDESDMEEEESHSVIHEPLHMRRSLQTSLLSNR